MRITAGSHRNRRLQVPKGQSVRPTPEAQRERLFNMIQHLIDQAEILDLYSGSGALSFEALSRGAAHATIVEQSKESLRCIQANAKTLGFTNQLTIISGDVLKVLPKLAKQHKQFLIIFADPPFEQQREGHFLTQLTLDAIDTLNLLDSNGSCFIEHAAKLPLKTTNLKQLTCSSSRKIGNSTLDRFEIVNT